MCLLLQGYAFCEYLDEAIADYVITCLHAKKAGTKTLTVKRALEGAGTNRQSNSSGGAVSTGSAGSGSLQHLPLMPNAPSTPPPPPPPSNAAAVGAAAAAAQLQGLPASSVQALLQLTMGRYIV